MSISFYALDKQNNMIQNLGPADSYGYQDNSLELNVHEGGAEALFSILELSDHTEKGHGTFRNPAKVERQIMDILTLLRTNPELDGNRETKIFRNGSVLGSLETQGSGAVHVQLRLTDGYLTRNLQKLQEIFIAALLAGGKVVWN